MSIWSFKRDYEAIERIKKQMEIKLLKKKQRILRKLINKEIIIGFSELKPLKFITKEVTGVVIKVASFYINLKRKSDLKEIEEEIISIPLDFIYSIKVRDKNSNKTN